MRWPVLLILLVATLVVGTIAFREEPESGPTKAPADDVSHPPLRPFEVAPEQSRTNPGDAIEAYRAAPGVRIHEEGFPTPREVAGTDEVHVGRVREDRVFRPGLAVWCVMDQLRKGAALNAVQIAEQAFALAPGA